MTATSFGRNARHDEHDADADADDAGGHPRQIGDRDAVHVGRVGHRAHQAGQQVAQAVGGQRALDRLEVDGARDVRQEMRWMAMQSPIVSIAPTSVSRTKAGSRAQKSGPKPRSMPGQASAGNPIQAASRDAPDVVDAEHDAADRRCRRRHPDSRGPELPGARAADRDRRESRPRVTAAVTGAAACAASAGTSVSLRRMIPERVTGISSSHGARHGRREDAPEQRELGGEHELAQRRDDDQARQQPAAAPLERPRDRWREMRCWCP